MIQNYADLQISDSVLKNLYLIELEKLLSCNGKSLKDYKSLPYPIFEEMFAMENRFIADELNYDKDKLRELHESLLGKLTEEQHSV